MNPESLLRVLVADDHDDIRLLVKALLEADGRFVVAGEARHGREAIQLARELEPDVVILDADMPLMGGLEALPKIRAALSAGAAIVVFSAHDHLRSQALRSGADGFLDKTHSVADLGDDLMALVAGAASRGAGP